jgi:demethylmenaquinone methyltransferase / 2-methoxy-6-polyprenyl-1,4-benzoquinol methylase
LDVARAVSTTVGFRGLVIGADFAEPMLVAGAGKVSRTKVAPVAADAVQLPIASHSVSGAIVAFGIRNVAGLNECLVETLRVLAPGARFVILEFSTPRIRIVRALYLFYFRHILPRIGRLVSGHRTAYTYLPRSVANFPVEEELAKKMRNAGFSRVRWRSLSFGIAAIHVGERAGAAQNGAR